MTFTILHGNNLDILPTLPDNSVDSIVTDPPYELGFMGKKWDSSGIAYSVELWTECLRVLKPGGHLLSFGGTRTFHRVAVAIEDAGFEIRDNIAWLYGSGFPKSLDVSKAIDKSAGAEREVIGQKVSPDGTCYASRIINARGPSIGGAAYGEYGNGGGEVTAPSTTEAQQWEGWGTALKPAHEPIIVARKPLIGTVAHNVLTHGTGALNIDGSRVGGAPPSKPQPQLRPNEKDSGFALGAGTGRNGEMSNAQGRWPANIILDEHTAGLLDEQSDASRFFYVAKASKRDRNEGLDDFPLRKSDTRSEIAAGIWSEMESAKQNFHPTVKPTALMGYLVKLVTPPNGTVLDPFTGSGSTGKAAILNGFDFIGIEMTEDYLPIIKARLEHAETEFAEAQADKGLF